MSDEQNVVTRIREAAEFVRDRVGTAYGVELAYDREGVAWLDGYIDRVRGEGVDEDEADELVETLGSFLGECICASFGGTWRETAHGWGVGFPGCDVVVYPYAKVRKHLELGPEDSALSLFNVTGALVAGERGLDAPRA